MKEPQNNDYFPLSEYENRIARLREEMRFSGMDAMLLSNEANVVYATGFLNGYWMLTMHDDTQLALIPGDPNAEPILFIPDHLMQVAWTSCISDVRTWTQFAGGNSKGPVATIADAFTELRLSTAKVGLEIGPHERVGMSQPFLSAFQAALPGVEFVDSSSALSEVRKLKSPLEISKFRVACDITCQAVQVGMDAIREGMSEKELAQVIACEMARLSPDACVNHPWFIFVYATGRGTTAFDSVPTGYRFQKGDAVYVDTGFKYQGYGADMIRCAVIGSPDKEMERYYYAARDTNMAAIRYVRPEIKGKHLYDFWTDEVRRIGFEDSMKVLEAFDWDFLGHGLGVTTHEVPLLNSSCEEVLQPGMVMAIEGNVFDTLPFSETRCALKNEEDVLVTEDGYEWLTPIPNDLYVIER